jgi:hypothetical protein
MTPTQVNNLLWQRGLPDVGEWLQRELQHVDYLKDRVDQLKAASRWSSSSCCRTTFEGRPQAAAAKSVQLPRVPVTAVAAGHHRSQTVELRLVAATRPHQLVLGVSRCFARGRVFAFARKA